MGYQIQVTGEWAGETGGWRPAIAGTVNQTGKSDAEASTFDRYDDAQATLDNVDFPELGHDEDRADDPSFRIVYLASGEVTT